MRRRNGPAIFLILVIWITTVTLGTGETISSVHLGSKIAVDGILFGVAGFCTWLIWVVP